MSRDELNVLAANSLLDRAMNSSSMEVAELLINSAHRLDNSIDVNMYTSMAQDAWIERQAVERNNG